MAKLNGAYESIVVFNTKVGDEGIEALKTKVKDLISANGTITNVEEWGKRKLAYPILDEVEGYYLFVEFTSAPEFPAELDRICKITDGVLRFLTVNKVGA